MTDKIARARLLAEVVLVERDLTRALTALAGQMHAILARYALLQPASVYPGEIDPADPPIPPTERERLRADLHKLIHGFFFGSGSLPYQVIDGEVHPTSAFLKIVWPSLLRAGSIGVDRHRDLIRKALKNEPALLALYEPLWMGQVSGIVREQDGGEELRPRPLEVYDPPHTWVDPNGYTLSERIWNTDEETRRRLDLYIDEAIATGKGSMTMVKELDQFLIPGQQLPFSNKPYGKNVSYNTMRLARTEINSAENRAAHAAGKLNPFVKRYRPVLSHAHPELDICDTMAAQEFEITDSTGVPPFHPNCLCGQEYIMEDDMQSVIDQIRADLKAEFPDKFTKTGKLKLSGAKLPQVGFRRPGEVEIDLTPKGFEPVNLFKKGTAIPATVSLAPVPAPVPPTPPAALPLPLQIEKTIPKLPQGITVPEGFTGYYEGPLYATVEPYGMIAYKAGEKALEDLLSVIPLPGLPSMPTATTITAKALPGIGKSAQSLTMVVQPSVSIKVMEATDFDLLREKARQQVKEAWLALGNEDKPLYKFSADKIGEYKKLRDGIWDELVATSGYDAAMVGNNQMVLLNKAIMAPKPGETFLLTGKQWLKGMQTVGPDYVNKQTSGLISKATSNIMITPPPAAAVAPTQVSPVLKAKKVAAPLPTGPQPKPPFSPTFKAPDLNAARIQVELTEGLTVPDTFSGTYDGPLFAVVHPNDWAAVERGDVTFTDLIRRRYDTTMQFGSDVHGYTLKTTEKFVAGDWHAYIAFHPAELQVGSYVEMQALKESVVKLYEEELKRLGKPSRLLSISIEEKNERRAILSRILENTLAQSGKDAFMDGQNLIQIWNVKKLNAYSVHLRNEVQVLLDAQREARKKALATLTTRPREGFGRPLTEEEITDYATAWGLDFDVYRRDVSDYVDGKYGSLRRAQYNAEFAAKNPDIADQAMRIELGLSKMPYYDGPIWRGVSVNKLDDLQGLGAMKPGQEWNLNAMSSFSRDRGAAFGGNVRIEVVNNRSGVSIEAIGLQGEKEVLVPANTRYKIIDIVERDKLPKTDPNYSRYKSWLVKLEEIL